MASLVGLPGAFILGAGAGSYKVAGVNCEVTPSPVLQSPSSLVSSTPPTPLFLTSSLFLFFPACLSLLSIPCILFPSLHHPFSFPPSFPPLSSPLLYFTCHFSFSPSHCPLLQDIYNVPFLMQSLSAMHVDLCPPGPDDAQRSCAEWLLSRTQSHTHCQSLHTGMYTSIKWRFTLHSCLIPIPIMHIWFWFH